MILILTPMLKEYHCAREVLHAKEESGDEPFRFSTVKLGIVSVDILQSGFKVQAALQWYLDKKGKPDLVIDSGSCGALKESLNIGEIVYSSQIKKMNESDIVVEHSSYFQKSSIIDSLLLEVSNPVKSRYEKKHLSGFADICTMESYQVHRMLKNIGVPCYSFRVITDLADENSRVDFKLNIRIGCIKLYKFLKKLLINISH